MFTLIKKIIVKVLNNRMLQGGVIVIILWYILHITLKMAIIPSPFATFRNFFELLNQGLLMHIGASAIRILVSVIISLLLAVPCGIAMGLNNKIDKILSPISYILYPIPKIAFVPIFLLLFGFGNIPKIILIVSIIYFQIVIAVRDSIKEIPTMLFYSMRSLHLSRKDILINLIIPAILPKLFTTLRVTTGISISVLFFSENFACEYGIGSFIMNKFSVIQYEPMYSGIIGLSIMGLILFKAIDFAEYCFCPWLKHDKV